MLDSPAQTPTPKSHNPSQPPPATNGANGDVTMSETAAPTNWLNNQKWRDEYAAVTTRMEHRAFKTRKNTHWPVLTPPGSLSQSRAKVSSNLRILCSPRSYVPTHGSECARNVARVGFSVAGPCYKVEVARQGRRRRAKNAIISFLLLRDKEGHLAPNLYGGSPHVGIMSSLEHSEILQFAHLFGQHWSHLIVVSIQGKPQVRAL